MSLLSSKSDFGVSKDRDFEVVNWDVVLHLKLSLVITVEGSIMSSLITHIWVSLHGYVSVYNSDPTFLDSDTPLMIEAKRRIQSDHPDMSQVPQLSLHSLGLPNRSSIFQLYPGDHSLDLLPPLVQWSLGTKTQMTTRWLNIRNKRGWLALSVCCKGCWVTEQWEWTWTQPRHCALCLLNLSHRHN